MSTKRYTFSRTGMQFCDNAVYNRFPQISETHIFDMERYIPCKLIRIRGVRFMNKKLFTAIFALAIAFALVAFAGCEGILPPSGEGDKTVNYYVDGEFYQSVSVNIGDAEPNVSPVKTGYEFNGWYADEECTERFDFDAFMADEEAESVNVYGVFVYIQHEHDLQYFAEKPATCTQRGHVEYWRCSLCGLCFSDENATREISETDIDALGHDMTFIEGVAATCTEDGIADVWHCSTCGLDFEDENGVKEIADRVIKSPGHIAVWNRQIDPTCTTEGRVGYWHCYGCNTDFADDDFTEVVTDYTIDALGHDMTFVEAQAHTCTDDGNVAYWHCGSCDLNYADESGEQELESVVDPAAHAWGEWEQTADPTCTQDGVLTRVCDVCHEKEYDHINALGHDMTFVPYREATCEENGWMEHWHCDRCGNDYSDEKGSSAFDPTINAYGHDWGSLEYVAYKESTCLTQGNIEHYHCDICGNNYSIEESHDLIEDVALEIDPDNHEYEPGWEYSDTEHWREPSCGHEDADDFRAKHDYGDDCHCVTCGYATEGTPGLEYEEYVENGELIGYQVTGIGSADVTDIVIPRYYADKSVVRIGYSAFSGCSGLTSVTIGNGVTSIGRDAFSGCSGLTDVYYTGDLAGWMDIEFGGSYANPTYYADNLYIDGELLEGDIAIPDGVTKINAYAFYRCSGLTSVIIPDGVTSIDGYAFA